MAGFSGSNAMEVIRAVQLRQYDSIRHYLRFSTLPAQCLSTFRCFQHGRSESFGPGGISYMWKYFVTWLLDKPLRSTFKTWNIPCLKCTLNDSKLSPLQSIGRREIIRTDDIDIVWLPLLTWWHRIARLWRMTSRLVSSHFRLFHRCFAGVGHSVMLQSPPIDGLALSPLTFNACLLTWSSPRFEHRFKDDITRVSLAFQSVFRRHKILFKMRPDCKGQYEGLCLTW